MALTRDQVFKAERRTRKVPVPEWGSIVAEHDGAYEEGHVYVRLLSGTQIERFGELQQRYDATAQDGSDNGKLGNAGLACELCIMLASDRQGVPLFSEKDCEQLMDVPFVAMQRIVEAGLDFNCLTDESFNAMRGNSSATPRDAPG